MKPENPPAAISEYRRMLAYKAGRNAALDGKSRASCRRQPGTIYFDDWCDAYDQTARVIAARQKGQTDAD